ncbi:MAG TPA: hypothetical protein VF681_01335 [Abditibacteriaceae bacterium]|jgi:hypothetical protein
MLDKKWNYAPKDLRALTEMEERIAKAAQQQTTVTYSEMVNGVKCQMPNVRGGIPFQIGVPEWTDFDRALLDDFLGYLCVQSYTKYGFMASVPAVSGETQMPGTRFFTWMREIGAMKGKSVSTEMALWQDQQEKAHVFYSHNKTVL